MYKVEIKRNITYDKLRTGASAHALDAINLRTRHAPESFVHERILPVL